MYDGEQQRGLAIRVEDICVCVCGGSEGGEFEIFVRPFYALAVVDIIRHYGWEDIWYLYSNDEGSFQSQPHYVNVPTCSSRIGAVCKIL